MKVHEYQGKQILKGLGVPVPEGKVAYSPEEAQQAAKDLAHLCEGVVVVKAQIHAGGRGKGGGVKLAKNPDEALALAKQILGMQLVTHQTGPEGQQVRKVLVEQGMKIERELYLGIVLDRAVGKPVIMASTEGGMEIEKVAAETPERIFKAWVEPGLGLLGFQARDLAFALGLKGDVFKNFIKMLTALYKAYEQTDATLAEINPLVVTKDGQVLALDAKMNFDDNAMYRHTDIREMRDLDEEDPLEVEAGKFNLNYIRLDGTIGCMVNGAGLAMATMDIIKLAGAEPANFLDVGGGANAEQVKNAMRILLSDSNVKGILINIFGGIMRCDVIAEGVITALKEIKLTVPMVVRLQGTNADKGREMLAGSGLPLHAIPDLAEAAQKIVALSKGGN